MKKLPWNSTPDPAANWNEETAPVCPTGWRLPTNAEVSELAANSNPVNGRWATAAQSGFPVNGAFFGPRANVCTSSDMGGCIFLPSGGERLEAAGALNGAGYWAFAWSSVQNSATTAHRLSLHTNLIVATNTYKARARCLFVAYSNFFNSSTYPPAHSKPACMDNSRASFLF